MVGVINPEGSGTDGADVLELTESEVDGPDELVDTVESPVRCGLAASIGRVDWDMGNAPGESGSAGEDGPAGTLQRNTRAETECLRQPKNVVGPLVDGRLSGSNMLGERRQGLDQRLESAS
eukprot:gb/GEZN01013209.1/.p1 GENE.gb/GEZN01013209.1/~~gb/GEZN01013209.1/.p1  ORF type:complete len:121 (-),score=5.90 gb/GEZN01013209.1/:599-961(-)